MNEKRVLNTIDLHALSGHAAHQKELLISILPPGTDYPWKVLPALLPILDEYHKNFVSFRKNFADWMQWLNQCPEHEILFLYQQTILIDKKKHSLLTIFLNFLHKDNSSLALPIYYLAKWLFTLDHSFLCTHQNFQGIYYIQGHHVRSCAFLRETLGALSAGSDDTLQKELQFLSLFLTRATSLETVTIVRLEKLLRDRLFLVQGTPQDYQYTSKNDPWKKLIQHFIAADTLYDHPFSFLSTSFASPSMTELMLYRQQHGFLYFQCAGHIFENFCHYSGRSMIFAHQKHTEIPREIVFELLDLVTLYFRQPTKEEFRHALMLWDKQLQACDPDDVNNINKLYTQRIRVRDKDMYLADVLVDVLEHLLTEDKPAEETLDAHMIGLAEWLMTYDRSLIINHATLDPLYAQYRVGRYFDVRALENLMRALLVQEREEKNVIAVLTTSSGQKKALDSRVIQQHLVYLIELLESKTSIDAEIFDHLRAMLTYRWHQICDTELDYTRLQKGKNKLYLELAESLSGAGFFPGAYEICEFNTPQCAAEASIGLQKDHTHVRYQLKNLRGDQISDSISLDVLTSDATLVDDLAALLPRILKITSARGHSWPLNHYYFLMDTLYQAQHDPIHLSSYIYFGLSHVVLNDELTTLISLKDAAHQLKAYGSFNYCHREFTSSELSRASFANRRYLRDIDTARYPAVQESLSLATVLALQKMVHHALYFNGLRWHSEYTLPQKKAAVDALSEFMKYYDTLRADERHRLDFYSIFLYGKKFTYKETREDMQRPEEDDRLCIALAMERISKIPSDFLDADLMKTGALDQDSRTWQDVIKSTGQRKKFYDHELYVRRLKALFVSLHAQWDAHAITQDATLKKISTELQDMFQTENFDRAGQVYVRLLALAEQSSRPWFWNDARSYWFKSISNESLFTHKEIWYEPLFLLQVLSPIAWRTHRYSLPVRHFLDDLVRIQLQRNSALSKKAEINIALHHVYQSLDGANRAALQSVLNYHLCMTPLPEDGAELVAHTLYMHIDGTQLTCTTQGFDGQPITKTFAADELAFPADKPLTQENLQPFVPIIRDYMLVATESALSQACIQFVLNRLKIVMPRPTLMLGAQSQHVRKVVMALQKHMPSRSEGEKYLSRLLPTCSAEQREIDVRTETSSPAIVVY